jgi:hypothetical protein
VLLEPDALDRRVREVGPAVSLGDDLLLARDRSPLVGHLEKEQERELLEVVLVGQAVVAEDVAVGPQLLDDPIGEVAHAARLEVKREPSACRSTAQSVSTQ